jgi:YbbR domain-containing protein
MKFSFDLRSIFSRVWDAMVENIGLKLLSFAFALGLYAFIHGSQDAQRTLSVDVVAKPPPETAHRVLLTPLPGVVHVTVRGPRTLLDEMKADDLGNFQLDLSSGKVDRIDFDPSVVHVPPGVRAEQIEPPSISLRWEDEIIRELPVQASITGQPAAGFVVKGAPKVEPSTVRTMGPRSVVDVVQFARAEAFDVTGIAKEGTYDRSLSLDRPPARVDYETQTVNVKIEIAREEQVRPFTKVPVQLVGAARGVVSPAEVDVKVQGPPDVVAALRPEQVVATVDLHAAGVNTASPGSAKLPVVVELEGCKATAQPQVVVVRW